MKSLACSKVLVRSKHFGCHSTHNVPLPNPTSTDMTLDREQLEHYLDTSTSVSSRRDGREEAIGPVWAPDFVYFG